MEPPSPQPPENPGAFLLPLACCRESVYYCSMTNTTEEVEGTNAFRATFGLPPVELTWEQRADAVFSKII
jgi:hypothetical protein